MNQLTPEQALQNLSIVTEPANIVKLSRQDFVNVAISLGVIETALKRLAVLESENPPKVVLEKP